jgi:hypothetical protein
MQFFELKSDDTLKRDNYYSWEWLIKEEARVKKIPIFELIDKSWGYQKAMKKYINKILENQDIFNDNINKDYVIFTDPSCLMWEYLLNKNPKSINIYFNYFKDMYSDSFFIVILKNLINKNPKLKVYFDVPNNKNLL